MKPTLAPLEQITALRLMARETVPADYRDLNNHMNVRYYMAIFDEAGYPLYEMLGLTPDILGPLNGGGFDLEHHLSYLNEVLIAAGGCRAPGYTEEQGVAAMAPDEIVIRVELGRADASATVWTTDFSYDYVRINAEYRS